MDRDRKVVSWPVLALIVAAILIAFAVLMHQSSRDLAALQAQRDNLQVEVDSSEAAYAQLRDELRRVGTDGFVENEAREKYDYIKEGEICFEFTNPEKLQNYTDEEWQVILDEKMYQ